MPTISFKLKNLEKLINKKLDEKQLEELLSFAKAELDGFDKRTNEVTVSCGDTNLPYLWSVEGIARLLKGVLGKEKGIPKLNVLKDKKEKYEIFVDSSVAKVRPFICAFVAKSNKINDYALKQIVQLQEKLCEGFGRRRQKVAIGVYSHKQIKFPIHYKAVDPESIEFVPLDFKIPMTQQEILETHPKGKDYAWILGGQKKYPILIDDNKEVLSFPPIINSNKTGKVEIGEDELFFEATGTDLNALILSTNIFAHALQDNGFKIYPVNITYPKNYKTKNIPAKLTTPFTKTNSIKISKESISKLLGIELTQQEIKKLLEKARFNFNNFKVEVPCYRADIIHEVDVIEEIGIMHGYNNLKSLDITERTLGKTFELTNFVDSVREVIIGLGYQEVFSPILINKEILYNKMNIKDFGTIEISNPVSTTYNCVRTWLLPILIDVLSKNKHIEYPQKIFEQGLVTVRKGDKKDNIIDYERIALVSAHKDADYTEARQCLDGIFNALGVKYSVKKTENDSFMKGRVSRVLVNKEAVAFIGELNPQVLENFDLEVPVAGFELNLTDLYNAINKNKK